MNIKLFTFQKEESDILEDWILYHSYLFGKENIHIVDHCSQDDSLDIIKKHGVKHRVFKGQFTNKRLELTNWMLEYKGKCDFLFPIDLDEFVVLNNQDFCCERNTILSYFNMLKNNYCDKNYKFKLKQFDSVPKSYISCDVLCDTTRFLRPKMSDRGKRRRKTFYFSKNFIETDQGNHNGTVGGKNEYAHTDLGLLHFPVRSYNHFIKKYSRWHDAYGKHNPSMGSPWKKKYDIIMTKKPDLINSAFYDLLNKKADVNIVCLKNKIEKIRTGEIQ